MRKWRKAVAMCMVAVMMCSMTACGSGNKESADTAAAPAETKAEGSETAAGESSAAGASSWTPEENVTMIVAYKADQVPSDGPLWQTQNRMVTPWAS